MRRVRDRRSGQALVESALIMLVMLPMMIGIADFGQFIYFHASLTDRVRAGARYGAVHTYTSPGTDIKKFTVYENATPADGAAPLIYNLTTSLVTATLDDAGTDSARITVTITDYPFNFLSPYMSKSTWYRTITATEPYEIP
jgi:Flp pilus assembly protein TadG